MSLSELIVFTLSVCIYGFANAYLLEKFCSQEEKRGWLRDLRCERTMQSLPSSWCPGQATQTCIGEQPQTETKETLLIGCCVSPTKSTALVSR